MAERKILTEARIGVLMGGQSTERDVSLRTGQAVHQSLVRRGYRAVAIDVGPTLAQDLARHQVEIAFLALHGPGGEDGTMQGFLETLGIPYTGSGVQASAIGMHKVTTKTLAASDWQGFAARKADAEKRGKLYGRGLASYVEWTSAMVMNEMAHYEVRADGKVRPYTV